MGEWIFSLYRRIDDGYVTLKIRRVKRAEARDERAVLKVPFGEVVEAVGRLAQH